jgi:hypothetical protein
MGRLNLAAGFLLFARVQSFCPEMRSGLHNSQLNMAPPDQPAGSFFHQVPDDDDKEKKGETPPPDFDGAISELIRQRRKPPRASKPSTINGVPTAKATGTSICSV